MLFSAAMRVGSDEAGEASLRLKEEE